MPRRDDDGYNDRPKKSWAEIDKARDGKRSRSSGENPAARERLEKSGEYSRYKSAADAFFSGNLLPDSLAEKVDPTGEGRARKDALKKLTAVEDFREFNTLSKEYVEKWGLPDDPYVLDRLLGHTNEGLVLKALAEIDRLVEANEFKAPKALPERLKSLEIGSDSGEVQDLAKALGKKLRNRPK